MEGRVFDAQVVLSPKNSPLGKVLSEYVTVRIVRMDDVDVGLFDRDWNNAIYFFVLMRRRHLVKTAAGPIGAEPWRGVPSAERAMPL